MSVDLERTLLGGQCFTWRKTGNCYSSVIDGRVVEVRDERDIRKEGLEDYFDLSFPYGEAGRFLSSLSPVMAQAVASSPGLHILRQSQWNATLEFITSQNNNIKRITMLLEKLSAYAGSHISGRWYALPTREQLSPVSEHELRDLGFGYRAPYLVALCNEFAPIPKDMDTGTARSLLMARKGIGGKVADCILLFSCHRMDVFPMDTWMKKVMAKNFPDHGQDRFAPYQALAQQYLFEAARNGVIPC